MVNCFPKNKTLSIFFRSKISKNFKKMFFFKVSEIFIHFIFFHGTEVWGKVLLKVLFFENNLLNFKLENLFFLIFSKKWTIWKIWSFFQSFLIVLEKILWEMFCFINKRVKHTFVHFGYVTIALELGRTYFRPRFYILAIFCQHISV